MGHAALPLACRQFPRQSVRDPRGVSVTLSHYCPTAYDLLSDYSGSISIVNNAVAFPAGAEYVGLTADHGLPPLLHPRLAMDWESWWLFEALSVSLLAEAKEPLLRLGLAVEYARTWTVDHGSLSAHLTDAFGRARAAAAGVTHFSASQSTERIADVMASIPGKWLGVATDALALPAAVPVDDLVSRRYLAAHAFANWTAYQGEGLRTWFRAIETAACLLRHTADPGRADLLLRHLADSTALIDRWKHADRQPAVGASG
jgi:hypothetical protein